MPDLEKAGGIEFLGQKLYLPTTAAGAISLIGVLVCISFTIVSISYIASKAPPENLRQVGNILGRGGVTAIRYEGNKLSSMHAMRQFQFMTPSSDSWKKALERYGSSLGDSEALKKKLGWMNVDESRVDQFGDQLIEKKFTQGWRRYPYEGQGHYRDVGWWWVITVDQDFSTDDFVKFYLNYWHTDEIYLEEFETFGDVLPAKGIPPPLVPKH